ncbi:hypothetical protein D3C77_392170 [compost metagenome]
MEITWTKDLGVKSDTTATGPRFSAVLTLPSGEPKKIITSNVKFDPDHNQGYRQLVALLATGQLDRVVVNIPNHFTDGKYKTVGEGEKGVKIVAIYGDTGLGYLHGELEFISTPQYSASLSGVFVSGGGEYTLKDAKYFIPK